MQPAQPIQRRQKIEYKKPPRVNVVSVSLAIVLALLCYAGYAFWPLFSLRSNVTSELAEALPHLWRLNLRPESYARPELLKLKRSVTDRLHKIGVKDAKLEVVFKRGKERVGMEARYTAVTSLPGSQRKFVLHFTPSVETDAHRVDW